MNSRKNIYIGCISLLALIVIFVVSFNVFRPVKVWVESATDRLASFAEEKDDIANTILSAIEGGDTLHQPEVIQLTNEERKTNGNVGTLTENAELDQAAQAKLNDMFDQQYFDHVSPEGKGPSDVAENAGYAYVLVGENLALGNFKDDQALLDAWMASPGHRANILNPDFVDMGAAVGEGKYQGKDVWMAVQEFGRPLSACPAISSTLKTQIDNDRTATDQMSSDLAAKKQALNTLPRSTSAEETAYDQKVSEYNAEVAEYNKNIAGLKTEINSYNAQVVAFNACLKK